MADILIRGMEMPTGCASCDFAIYHTDSAYHYCFWLKKVFIKPDAKLKDCPLVELPEHGDLIERDDIVEHYRKAECNFGSDRHLEFLTVHDWIEEMFVYDLLNVPVIVPSNKEETK